MDLIEAALRAVRQYRFGEARGAYWIVTRSYFGADRLFRDIVRPRQRC